MVETNIDELFELFYNDAEHLFFGWDFSYIDYRMTTSPLNWSYPSKIIPYVRTVTTMLDMGTGGGEFLHSLQPLPKHTFATEAYTPNIPIAKNKLEPIGVIVKEINSDNKLPFEDDFFDLIINRHESYLASEVYRILRPGGLFITQQVGGRNDIELNQLLGCKVDDETIDYLHWDLDYAVNELESNHFIIIEQKEDSPKTRFYDIGAILFYIKACPWQIPDFPQTDSIEKLRDLHRKILKEEYIETTSERFLIIARKPK